jgi:hypothetical protein
VFAVAYRERTQLAEPTGSPDPGSG